VNACGSFVATTAFRLLRVTVRVSCLAVCVCVHVASTRRQRARVFGAARFEVLSAALTKRQVFCDVRLQGLPDLTT
jgi:hypothetical protein